MDKNEKQAEAHSKHQHHHTEQVLNQLQSSIENLHIVQKMISEQRPCLDVLTQLAGIFVRLDECRMTIVHDHISSCFGPNLKNGQENLLLEIEKILRLALQSKGVNNGSFH